MVMNISVGDVCKVDMAMASKIIGGFGGHQLKILKDVVRQGGGLVDVEEIRGDNATVSAHDNPMSKIVGGVGVPVRALRQVENPVAPRYAKIAKRVVGMTLARERLENAKRMIAAGGRGIELGIREIAYLTKDMDDLYKQMRRIQSGGLDDRAPSVQADLLEVLGRFM
jgi:hypothetical protein